jgi:hypothetical protein
MPAPFVFSATGAAAPAIESMPNSYWLLQAILRF